MNYKKFKKIIASMVVLAMLIIKFQIPMVVSADDTDTSYAEVYVDGKLALTVTMNKGVIIIDAQSKAASTTTRWETIGLTITREKVNENGSTVNGYTGPGLVNEAYGSGHGAIIFNEDEKKDTVDGTTRIVLSTERVKAAIGGNFDNLTKDTPLFLHCIFDTYEIINGKKVIRKGEDGGLRNWKDIMNAEWWGPDTLKDFKKFYNMPILFKPTPKEPNTLYFDLDGKVVYQTELEDKEINEEVTWKNKANSPTVINGKTFELTGFYVKNKITNKETERRNVGDTIAGSGNTFKLTADYILNSASATVQYGGMNVYLIYQKKMETSYQYNAVAIDKDGNYLRHLTTDRISVKSGEKVSYNPIDSFTKSSKQYKFQNKWYLKYKDTKGTVQTIPTETTAAVRSYPMPAAEAASLATFYFVYDTGTPTPTPNVPFPTAAPTPTPSLEEITAPAYDSAFSEFTKPVTTGEIRADDRGSEKFTATLGVPTTEGLYGQVKAKEYLLGYFFEKKVGIKHYSVKVSKSYNLTWKSATPPGSKVPGKTQTETVTITQYISVPRAYGYWQINNLDYYTINKAILRNYALPDGLLTLTPNSTYYNPPSISYAHETSEDYHIIPPNEAINGITLPTQSITGGTSKPQIPKEDFSYYALSQTGNCKVRSDSLIFGGQTVMSGAITETEAPRIDTSAIPQCTTYTNQNVLYKNDQVIKATKKNGVYGSSGTITYNGRVRIGSTISQESNYPVEGINDVVIHTPVICDPVVTADNDKWVQLINPTKDCIQLVLDPDPELSDFYVKVSNTGLHTGMSGYYTRDFSRSLHDTIATYLAEKNGLLRNEVKFPFDVFIDIGNDKDQKNDDYIKAGTWVTLGRATARFYLPTWITEDVYTVNFRTVSVNVEDDIDKVETYANRSRLNYVATNTVKMEISGRIYGLSIYDISDYPMWESVFRVPKSSILKKNSSSYTDGTSKTTYNKNYYYNYTVGTNDQYGKDTGRNVKYTFPLINGSHPYYKNQGILKTGYMIRFSLDTIGNFYSDAASVVLRPSFYYVDKNGKNRKAVDLYYQEEIGGKSRSLVKVGGSLDAVNVKSYNTGDLNLGIPKAEMKLTAALRNTTYNRFFWQHSAMFTFAKIQPNYAFRTLVGQNYTAKLKKLNSYPQITAAGINASKSDKSMQRWYGQYYIPNSVHIAPKGYDVMDYADKYGVDYTEDFWLADGYIIVNMNIYTIDENKKQRLSYVNASNYKNNGNCSMWMLENPPLSKASYKGAEFSFFAGDFFIYYGDNLNRASSDFTSGAIY